MRKQTRRQFASAFKAKVTLEPIKGQHTLAELAKKFEVNQVATPVGRQSSWQTWDPFLISLGSPKNWMWIRRSNSPRSSR